MTPFEFLARRKLEALRIRRMVLHHTHLQCAKFCCSTSNSDEDSAFKLNLGSHIVKN
jgi:hypothetical protein